MKILIGQSYFRLLDPKELKRNMPYPPLGPLYIATILRNLGHDIIFHDGMIAKETSELSNLLLDSKPDLFLLYDDEFNYLTKMCLTNMRDIACEYIAFAKNLGIPVFVYNSDAMDHADVYLKAGCDVIVIGEAEQTVLELIENINLVHTKNYETLEKIHGIKFFNDNSELIYSGIRQLLLDLNSLPDPDYSLTDIDKYKTIWINQHHYFSLNISTTRGCPYSCNWCAKPLWGRTYAMFDPLRIVNLLQRLVQTYNIDHVWITDDIFGLKHSWLQEFSNLIVSRQLYLKKGIKCLSRADLLVKNETLELLKMAGISNIWVGAESGSQAILDRMDKNITTEQIHETVKIANKLGISISFFIQFGYLYETWKDIQMTRTLIKDCVPDDIGISVSYPLPGTKFYTTVSNLLTEKKNWTDSDDLDLMYIGNYPSKFYKLLHRFVHIEYNLVKMMKRKKFKLIYILPLYSVLYVYFRIRLQFYLANT